ncbi:DUF2017 domain-containing protein [Streptacidiphilus carbonis]|jgi:hypothetical protein|uniref:DUF2017 domain-containing protein n=1 Tax=Streptacidiphilus carbonis TaxID=105422 RepID=UPI0005A80975|nr:DUF2017 domain-containing protein [Streptacidiphilus carbonis]
MAGLFKPARHGGASLTLDPVEVSILRNLSVQMLELLGPGDEPEADEDPLARLFAEGPSKAPEDPALARLFPDAYTAGEDYGEGEDAGELSAEFRRFTENDLRARKRDDALAVVRSLDGAGSDRKGRSQVQLDKDGCTHWLGGLNDLRLTLGSRLEVSDDPEEAEAMYRLPDEDPRKPLMMAYLWLGGLQETLIEAMAR